MMHCKQQDDRPDNRQVLHYDFAHIRQMNDNVIGHTSLHVVTPANGIPLHDHDFYEVELGIENSGVQLLNGNEKNFHANDIYILRPEDVHEIHSKDEQPFTYYNLAFEGRHVRMLCERYRLDIARKWLEAPDWPRRWRIPIGGICTLRMAFRDIARNRFSEVELHRFLLNLFAILEDNAVNPYQECPEWLQDAIGCLEAPKWLQMGPRALSELTGFTQEYVSRTLQKCAGVTPGEVLNRMRMQYAALQLSLTMSEPSAIAEQCGIHSMSYFFKLFQRTYACTPKEYRMRYR